jgi:hypothetical protein
MLVVVCVSGVSLWILSDSTPFTSLTVGPVVWLIVVSVVPVVPFVVVAIAWMSFYDGQSSAHHSRLPKRAATSS